ncbi:hypothetical protein F4781DRAFT_119767 [Annulohypoxylon bovei var. microspora]|nr:hypothetical protein F4781DRAFT_119767 [Annulohypoxylon bovei var. microspora]
MLALRVLRTQRTPSRLRCNIHNLQTIASHKLSPRQNLRISGLRFESTAPKPKPQTSPQPAQKYVYPERLCVYHAGTPRILVTACLKLSAIIIVITAIAVAPITYETDGLSPVILRTILSLTLLLFTSYTGSPFVAFMHLRLPLLARTSPDMLRRHLRSLPPSTILEITTMGRVARPRLNRVALAELYRTSQRLRIVNLARARSAVAAYDARRRWYSPRAVERFSALTNVAKTPEWAWESVLGAIRKGPA